MQSKTFNVFERVMYIEGHGDQVTLIGGGLIFYSILPWLTRHRAL